MESLVAYETIDEATFQRTLEQLADAYESGNPLVDDATYDALVDIYEARFGEYKRVGAPVRGQKVRLPYYLSSVRAKIKTPKQLSLWAAQYPGPYVLEDKIDGLTLLFTSTMERGRRVYRLYTRGDSVEGLEVSHMIDALPIPKVQFDLAVRGEVVMHKDTFQQIGGGYKNPRNMVAGIVNRRESYNPDVARHLHFYAFRVMDSQETPETQILQLRAVGFETPWATVAQTITVPELDTVLQARRAEAPYEMDGMVVYQNRYIDYPVGEPPRQVIAYKGSSPTALHIHYGKRQTSLPPLHSR